MSYDLEDEEPAEPKSTRKLAQPMPASLEIGTRVDRG